MPRTSTRKVLEALYDAALENESRFSLFANFLSDPAAARESLRQTSVGEALSHLPKASRNRRNVAQRAKVRRGRQSKESKSQPE